MGHPKELAGVNRPDRRQHSGQWRRARQQARQAGTSPEVKIHPVSSILRLNFLAPIEPLHQFVCSLNLCVHVIQTLLNFTKHHYRPLDYTPHDYTPSNHSWKGLNAFAMQHQKLPLLFVLGSIMALGPFSIDMYLPAFKTMAIDFDTDTTKVGYSLTSFFAGLVVGQLFYGILIDRFGRKKPLIIGYLIYIVASLGCAFAPNLEALVAFRFLMALGGCSGMVISRAIVRDVFSGSEIAKTFSQLVLVMGIAPIIAPTIGGFINSWLGWQWIFGAMVLIGLANLLLIVFVLPETKGPDESISLKGQNIWSEYQKVFKYKSFILYAVAGSFAYAGLFAYLTASPLEFMERLGLSDTEYAWAFAFNASGFILGSQVNRLVLLWHNELSASLRSVWTQLAVAIALLVFSYLHLAGLTLTITSTFLYLFMLGILNPNTQALALRPFTKEAGRSAALMGSIQMVAGVLTSGLISFLDRGEVPVMAIAMLVCTVISLSLLLISRFGSFAEPNTEYQQV